MKKIIIICVLSIILTGGIIYFYLSNEGYKKTRESKFANLEKNLVELEKDVDFYKKFDIYINLLKEEDYKAVTEYINKIEDLEEFKNTFILYLLNEMFKDEKLKTPITNLKSEVYTKRNDDLDRNLIFERNTACANLSNGISEQLSKKYKARTGISEKEELDFIFYSPNLNACVYSTEYKYNQTSPDYWTKDEKRVYNGSSQSLIKSFSTHYYEYPYLSKDKAEKETENGKREYVKFILENSNYNADLLKDMSIF